MEIQQFLARKHSHLSDRDAEKIGKYLHKKFGDSGVTPEQFVDAARPKSSPLHDYIEWVADEGLRQWQLQQARMCLNSIEVVIVEDDTEYERTRLYEVVVRDGERSYTPILVIKGDPDLSDQVRARFARDIAALEDRMERFDGLGKVVAVMRQARELLAA